MFWCTGLSPDVLTCLLVDWSVSVHYPVVFLCPFAVLSRTVLMLLEGDISLVVINQSDLLLMIMFQLYQMFHPSVVPDVQVLMSLLLPG